MPCQFWLVSVVHVFRFGFFLHPAIPGWGVGACALLRALRLYPATPSWGSLWRGAVWGSLWAGFLPPPCFFFAVYLAAGGGGLWVWFSALSCCGSLAVAFACLCLGPLGLRPPSPLRLGLFFQLCPCPCGRWPATSPVGVCAGVSGVPVRPALPRLCGRGGLLFLATRLPTGRGGPPVSYRRAPWVSPLVLPDWQVGRLCGLGARLRGCATVPPDFLLSRWPAGVRSWIGGVSPALLPLDTKKSREIRKRTPLFLGGPPSESTADKADITELLSQCHSMIAELRVSEKDGKGDKGGKGSGKGKGRKDEKAKEAEEAKDSWTRTQYTQNLRHASSVSIVVR